MEIEFIEEKENKVFNRKEIKLYNHTTVNLKH